VQLVLNFKSVVVGTALVVAGFYGYRTFVADIESEDVGQLIRSHRDSQSTRQLIIKRRIVTLYRSGRDYVLLCRALDSPSPATQALAVGVLAAKNDDKAIPKLLDMLRDTERADVVKEELADALAGFRVREAVPRLIELTDTRESQSVRAAAHSGLQAITGAGAEVKLGDATRQNWTLWWRNSQPAGSP
jgi:hypothetical protein